MKNTKIRVLALAAALLIATTVAMSACDQGETKTCTTHTDTDKNGVCDVCGEAVTTASQGSDTTAAETTPQTEAPLAQVDVTLTVKDQNGNLIPAAIIRLTPAKGEDMLVTTNAEGSVTTKLTVGDYTLTYDELPDNCIGGTSMLTVVEGMAPVSLEIIDNTPDGTETHPFFINEDSTTFDFPAETTYNFTMFSGDRRTLVLNSATAEIVMNGTTYKPDENGRIAIRITSEKQQDHTSFTVKNLSAEAQSFTLLIESDPGSFDNPIAVTALDTAITANVPKDLTVYYTWTATVAGELVMTSADKANNICLNNITNFKTTNFTNGAESVSVLVAVGDQVTISVSALNIQTPDDEDPNNTPITFTLTVRPATENNG